ncbi:MAG: YegS/Rv2252/BmrU family lipid kinase [Pleurocapsa sp.]
MTRSAYLIFNPAAGQNDSQNDLAKIQTILEPAIQLEIQQTAKGKSVAQLVAQALEKGAEMIIASGGDGTLSKTSEALIGTGIPFGVIPRGTANAFAAAMGIPQSIEAACEIILAGKTRAIDAASCNGQPMVLLTGIGYEAETIAQADRTAKNRFGVLAYILSGIRQLRRMRSFKAEIETEDQSLKLLAVAITIANAAPTTSVLAQGAADVIADDGLLDLTIVTPGDRQSFIAALFQLLRSGFNHQAVQREDVIYLRAKRIRVSAKPQQKVIIDGNLRGTTPVEIECLPNGLTILVPA